MTKLVVAFRIEGVMSPWGVGLGVGVGVGEGYVSGNSMSRFGIIARLYFVLYPVLKIRQRPDVSGTGSAPFLR